MNILLLGSQHGNELLGDRLYAYIKQNAAHLLPHITFRIGNPKAHARGERYIESDMNRSYDPQMKTYEASRARRIKQLIEASSFDLVLDLHTTVCIQPPCVIIEALNDSNRRFLKASTINKIVLMRHDMVKKSLIGTFPQAIAIEIANHEIDASLPALCDDLECYINGKVGGTEKSVYPVDELILKSSVSTDEAKNFQNFTQSTAGFIPILVGENSYKKNTEYLGFKANKEVIITL